MAEKTEFKTVETSQEDLEELEEKIRRHRHKIARRTGIGGEKGQCGNGI